MTLVTGDTPTLTGCFRNAEAVACAAARLGRRVAVIPAGERSPGGSLRPGLEDWLGAGAVIDRLAGAPSPEADSAAEVFRAARADLRTPLARCRSGQELIGRGYAGDVALASELDVSGCVPRFVGHAYVNTAAG